MYFRKCINNENSCEQFLDAVAKPGGDRIETVEERANATKRPLENAEKDFSWVYEDQDKDIITYDGSLTEGLRESQKPFANTKRKVARNWTR